MIRGPRMVTARSNVLSLFYSLTGKCQGTRSNSWTTFEKKRALCLRKFHIVTIMVFKPVLTKQNTCSHDGKYVNLTSCTHTCIILLSTAVELLK